tara:strand:- start:1357 stop:1467 length:111 start_codon:yes stop_codon:yes gene_type:complete
MTNLDSAFTGIYESISKHMKTYEQKLIQKEEEKRRN